MGKVTSEQTPVCKSVHHQPHQPHQLSLTTLERTQLLLTECGCHRKDGMTVKDVLAGKTGLRIGDLNLKLVELLKSLL